VEFVAIAVLNPRSPRARSSLNLATVDRFSRVNNADFLCRFFALNWRELGPQNMDYNQKNGEKLTKTWLIQTHEHHVG
jgi:hypothetical protein